jgi:Acetyltransferase (GNAT) domain
VAGASFGGCDRVFMGEIFDSFADAEPLARAELDREGLTSLFDRFDWFARTQAECPTTGSPMIVHARDESAELWLFLSKDHRGRAHGLTSWYTLSYRPVFVGNPDDAVRASLLKKVSVQLRPHAATIALSPMREAECMMTARAFQSAGWRADMVESGCNWTVDVKGKSFADYWAERPSKLKKTVKSKRAKAAMEVSIVSHFCTTAWRDYEHVYANSWKPNEGAAEFLRQMAQTEGAAGTLRLGVGRIDGLAVAAQLWTCENGRAIAHKVAHRQDAIAYSPGSLLSAAMFEHVIDSDRVDCIDFGTGDSPYKTAWMDQCAPLFTLTLYNRTCVSGVLLSTKARALGILRRARAR